MTDLEQANVDRRHFRGTTAMTIASDGSSYARKELGPIRQVKAVALNRKVLDR
jgi:hypothetical protein